MNIVQLHEWTPKQFLNPTLNPKIAHYGRNCLVTLRKHDDSKPKSEKKYQDTQLMENKELSDDTHLPQK